MVCERERIIYTTLNAAGHIFYSMSVLIPFHNPAMLPSLMPDDAKRKQYFA